MKDKTISFTIPLVPEVLRAMSASLLGMAGGPAEPSADELEWRKSFYEWKKDRRDQKEPPVFTKEQHQVYKREPDAETTTAEQAFGLKVTAEGNGNATIGPGLGPDQLPGAKPTYCAICGGLQFNTHSGRTCENGHGGADSLDAPPAPAGGMAAKDAGNTPKVSGESTYEATKISYVPPAVELDAAGLPHDIRIYTKSKGKLKNGNWKRKPGVDPMFVVRVETELRAALAVQAPTPPAHGTPTDPACAGCNGVANGECEACKAETAARMNEARAQSINPGHGTEPPAPAGTITTFAELNAAIINSNIDIAKAEQAVQALGLASYALLSTRPDLVPHVVKALGL